MTHRVEPSRRQSFRLKSLLAALVTAAGLVALCAPVAAADSFEEPHDVAVDAAGNVYVAAGNSPGFCRVVKFSPTGELLLVFGGSCSSGTGFHAAGIALDTSGNIYLADTGNDRIRKFSPTGVHQLSFGSDGVGNGQFTNPEDVAVGADGDIYVTDGGNSRIQVFSSAGTHELSFGAPTSPGAGNGAFGNGIPKGIAVDASSIYVTDTSPLGPPPNFPSGDLQKFSLAGAFQATIGSPGTGTGQFSFPRGIALDTSGNIFVADTFNNRIQKFNSAGIHQLTIGSMGSADGQLENPGGVAVDSSGNIWVADSGNVRIQKFGPTGNHLLTIASFGGTPPPPPTPTPTATPTLPAASPAPAASHGKKKKKKKKKKKGK